MEVSSLKVQGQEMVVEKKPWRCPHDRVNVMRWWLRKSHWGVLIKGSRSRDGGWEKAMEVSSLKVQGHEMVDEKKPWRCPHDRVNVMRWWLRKSHVGVSLKVQGHEMVIEKKPWRLIRRLGHDCTHPFNKLPFKKRTYRTVILYTLYITIFVTRTLAMKKWVCWNIDF
jgi:hypothetical protein